MLLPLVGAVVALFVAAFAGKRSPGVLGLSLAVAASGFVAACYLPLSRLARKPVSFDDNTTGFAILFDEGLSFCCLLPLHGFLWLCLLWKLWASTKTSDDPRHLG